MRMTFSLVVALTFSAASATASLAGQSGTATGGNAPSSGHGTHKPGVKPAMGSKDSAVGKGATVDPSAAAPGAGGSGSKRDAHMKKKGNGSQASGVGTQPAQGASLVGDTGRNAIGAKITNTAGASNGPGLGVPQPAQGARVGGDTGRSAIAAKITNTNGTTQGGRTGLGTGVTKNVATSVAQGQGTMPRNAGLITGTGMGPKGAAPPVIRPAAKNNTSINGTGLAGKN